MWRGWESAALAPSRIANPTALRPHTTIAAARGYGQRLGGNEMMSSALSG